MSSKLEQSTTASGPAPSRKSSTSSREGEDKESEQPYVRQAYVYVDKVKAPNPDAQPKKKSKIGAFFSQFKSPAVQKTTALRDHKKLEEERTGVKTVQVTDTSRSSNAWAAEGVGHATGGY